MSIAVGALYIRKYFNEDSKQTALEMVNDIRYAPYFTCIKPFNIRIFEPNIQWTFDYTKMGLLVCIMFPSKIQNANL